MTTDQALAKLQHPDGDFTRNTVKGAWAKAVAAVHPDGGGPAGDAASQIATLTKARDLLLSILDGSNRACVLCKGVGKVRGRWGATPCTACKGKGDKIG